MKIDNSLTCPKCSSKCFQMKREATYQYTYELNCPDQEEKSWLDKKESLPYLFDNREQLSEKEYLLCKECGSCYPCYVDKDNNQLKMTILQKAYRTNFHEKPEFFG
ncbi:MAG: hypothetical protein Q8936_18040 [Bacillota bacterium]|nr:hypothetical protein [Bacillota bacterium]